MRQNVASVLTYMMRDPGLCEMFIWDLEAGLKELKTRLANNRRNPQPNFDLDCADKTELLEFLHSTVQIGAAPLGPKVLEIDGRRFTGAEVMYVISWNVGAAIVQMDGGGGDSQPPTPPPPPYKT